MATVLKRPLTEEEKADARRLKSAWEFFRADNKGCTQDWLGDVTGLGGQSVIGQYLNGVIQLNHKALLSMCSVIGADPASISPTLAAKIPPVGNVLEGESQQHLQQHSVLVYVAPEEMKILTLYRESTPMGKNLIVDAATAAEKSRTFAR
jgi:hypothetical protein